MVRRMHPVLASHVVKVHAYLRSISFALSLSLLRLSLLLSLFIPFHFRENTLLSWTHEKGSLSLSLSVSLAQRVRARKNAGTAVIKIIGVIIFDREERSRDIRACMRIQRNSLFARTVRTVYNTWSRFLVD